MGVFTTVLNLFKPATVDYVDVVADLNANWDKIEAEAVAVRAKTQTSLYGTGSSNFTGGTGGSVNLVLPVGTWTIIAKGRYNWSTTGNPFFSSSIFNVTDNNIIDSLDKQQSSSGDTQGFALMGQLTVATGTKSIQLRHTTASPGNGTQLADSCTMVAICG